MTFSTDASGLVVRDEHGVIAAFITPGVGLTAERVAAALNDCEGIPTSALQQGWVRLACDLTGHLLNPTAHTDTCMDTVAMARASNVQPRCNRICAALRALRSAVLGAPVRAAAGVLGAPWDTPIPALSPRMANMVGPRT